MKLHDYKLFLLYLNVKCEIPVSTEWHTLIFILIWAIHWHPLRLWYMEEYWTKAFARKFSKSRKSARTSFRLCQRLWDPRFTIAYELTWVWSLSPHLRDSPVRPGENWTFRLWTEPRAAPTKTKDTAEIKQKFSSHVCQCSLFIAPIDVFARKFMITKITQSHKEA